MSLDFVAIDVETAAPTWETICSVALVRVADGRIVDQYNSLINPECDFNPKNVRIHGITQAMVQDAPMLPDIAGEMLDFLGKDILISHNVPFDANALQRALNRYQIPFPEITTFCTLACAKIFTPKLEHFTLPALCREYHIEQTHHHDAMDDAKCCALAMIAMANRMEATSLEDVADKLHIRFGSLTQNYVQSPSSLMRQSIYGAKKANAPTDNPFAILEDLKDMLPNIANELSMSQLKDARTLAFKCADSLLFYLTIGDESSFIKVSGIDHPELIYPYFRYYKDGACKLVLNNYFDYSVFLEAISKVASDRYSQNISFSFACCNDFIRCSDAMQCLKADNPEYRGCQYRQNLENGRIFYGKNRNI